MLDKHLLPYYKEVFIKYKEEVDEDGNIVVSEMSSGNWWKNTEADLRARKGEDSFLLPIILYLDGTLLDVTGKQSAKPICVTLGNFSGRLRVCIIIILILRF